MKFYQSIRFRMIAGILLFGLLIITLNAGVTFFIMGNNMSRMIRNLIDTEVDSFLYKYERDRTTALPHSKYLSVYEGVDEIPQRFRKYVKDLGPGVHTVMTKRHPLHVGVMELEGQKNFYYMFFHGREFFHENAYLNPKQILMLSWALVLIPVILLGFIVSRTIFAPVFKLMDKVKVLNPEKIPTQFFGKHANNEIGMLTKTIEKTMKRVNAFIQREKQFTRDASHELRTPLTIIKGAVEIMEQQPELESNPLLKKPVNRISNSVRDMENTIETFLWLAREEDETDEQSQVEKVTQKAIQDNLYLIEKKQIKVQVKVIEDSLLKVKEEVLYIAIANLIRNAFHYTSAGSVNVVIAKDHISVQDTGMGIAQEKLDSITKMHFKGENSRGFGLGLSIVSRLCARFSWDLEIESQIGKGTKAVILWHKASKL